MASTEEHTTSSKIAPEAQVQRNNHSRGGAKFSPVDLSLRLLVFASSLTAVLLMVTSKQTEFISVPGIPIQVPNTAKFNYTPAFVYFVVALSVAGLHSIVSILGSLVRKQSHSNKLLFHYILMDLLMVGIVVSATGTAGGIAYTGLKGNSHAGWGKICNVYDKFCRYVGISLALSLFASVLLVVLVMLSTYTLYRRST
ncbi:hypothetical protein AQUCO_00300862v1 [Aquilegia coerulea]|uniref:CASP-like protein n=1 Tax=Aquilegia coerulea TaxID=218851 RepID=A0A2G5F0Y4_AQUCA|nr:hypothetical protein AQUCO_00300862v1 [Aquilegia coerulea]